MGVLLLAVRGADSAHGGGPAPTRVPLAADGQGEAGGVLCGRSPHGPPARGRAGGHDGVVRVEGEGEVRERRNSAGGSRREGEDVREGRCRRDKRQKEEVQQNLVCPAFCSNEGS